MAERLLADALVVIHLGFIGYVVFGGLTALLRWWLALVHLPALCWGAWIEFSGWICPLTPLEQELRRAAGEAGYDGGFIEHYLIGIIYPAELTRDVQVLLGVAVLLINAVVYVIVVRRWQRAASAG